MRQFEALTANARRSSDASPLLLAREISCEKASDCSEASSSEPEEAASGSGACDVVNSSPSRWPMSHPGAYVVQRIFNIVKEPTGPGIPRAAHDSAMVPAAARPLPLVPCKSWSHEHAALWNGS